MVYQMNWRYTALWNHFVKIFRFICCHSVTYNKEHTLHCFFLLWCNYDDFSWTVHNYIRLWTYSLRGNWFGLLYSAYCTVHHIMLVVWYSCELYWQPARQLSLSGSLPLHDSLNCIKDLMFAVANVTPAKLLRGDVRSNWSVIFFNNLYIYIGRIIN